MEQLEPSQRESVKKMSTDRLRTKLTEAGFSTQQITDMTREQLLETWAKVVLSSKEVAATAKVPTVGYDVELERMRLEFEMKKFEAEEARRREEMEAAKLKEERDEARRREERELEEARRREEKELEEARWRQERELQEQELHMRRDQWEWQKQRDVREGEKQNTPAAQVKFFGNVLKNVMPKFPSDSADVPIFFEGVEKLFQSFEVPNSLKSKLLLPYLNDKAKSLLLRLDLLKQDNYSEVKSFLLNEFKLTPMQFKERFDRAVRNKDETCTMFCSRLKNLLTYYCNGRQVKESFKTLFSLLVADKIKSTLPEACLDHVLTAEGITWLECDTLASTVDIILPIIRLRVAQSSHDPIFTIGQVTHPNMPIRLEILIKQPRVKERLVASVHR